MITWPFKVESFLTPADACGSYVRIRMSSGHAKGRSFLMPAGIGANATTRRDNSAELCISCELGTCVEILVITVDSLSTYR